MSLVATIVIWVFGAFGLFWIGSAIFAPRWFIRNLSITRIYKKESNFDGDSWWSFPTGLLVVIAIGRVVYCAAYAVTFVIPLDWGGKGEDGDWVSTRFYVQVVMAIIGALLLGNSLEKSALAASKSLDHNA